MDQNITVRETIFIDAPIERVWDYTQDFTHRPEWDRSIVDAEVLQREPAVVRVKVKGGVSMTATYKLRDRPRKTSLVMTDSTSRILSGGGGSWSYEPSGGGTSFTQTNTITVRRGP